MYREFLEVLWGQTPGRPPTNLYETEEAFVAEVALPGIPREAIHVMLEEDTLVVRTDPVDPGGKPRRYHQLEISLGPFELEIRLGRTVDREAIQTRYQAGLLVIVLPRKKPRSITIPVEEGG